MQGKVISQDGHDYTIRLNNGFLTVDNDYLIEDATGETGEQRRAREALIMAYWKSGVHPKWGGDGYEDFRDKLKRSLGEGFNRFIYVTIELGKPRIHEVKKYEEIPEEIRRDEDMRDMIRGKLKSCSRYTKKQNQRFIDNIIDDATANGCNTDKWNEIMRGMSESQGN